MLILAGVASTPVEARFQLENSITTGRALEKFRAIIEAQGGDPRVVDDPAILPRSRLAEPVVSRPGGWVRDVDARGIALAALRLGAGRSRAEDAVDPAVGIDGLVKIGERVAPGGTICLIHSSDRESAEAARALVEGAISISPEPCAARSDLVGEILT